MLSTETLDRRPHLVGTVSTREGLHFLHVQEPPADLIEIRVDALHHLGVTRDEIREALQRRRHPVLLTPRIPEEGGLWTWHGPERLNWTLELLHEADALDLEMQSVAVMREAWELALANGKKVVLSAHSIETPATPEQLRAWGEVADTAQPWCAKIAARVESPEHLRALAAFLLSRGEQPWAVMGVGPKAGLSRTVLAALGSRLVYGWLDTPAAPGQPSAADLRTMLDSLT